MDGSEEHMTLLAADEASKAGRGLVILSAAFPSLAPGGSGTVSYAEFDALAKTLREDKRAELKEAERKQREQADERERVAKGRRVAKAQADIDAHNALPESVMALERWDFFFFGSRLLLRIAPFLLFSSLFLFALN